MLPGFGDLLGFSLQPISSPTRGDGPTDHPSPITRICTHCSVPVPPHSLSLTTQSGPPCGPGPEQGPGPTAWSHIHQLVLVPCTVLVPPCSFGPACSPGPTSLPWSLLHHMVWCHHSVLVPWMFLVPPHSMVPPHGPTHGPRPTTVLMPPLSDGPMHDPGPITQSQSPMHHPCPIMVLLVAPAPPHSPGPIVPVWSHLLRTGTGSPGGTTSPVGGSSLATARTETWRSARVCGYCLSQTPPKPHHPTSTPSTHRLTLWPGHRWTWGMSPQGHHHRWAVPPMSCLGRGFSISPSAEGTSG